MTYCFTFDKRGLGKLTALPEFLHDRWQMLGTSTDRISNTPMTPVWIWPLMLAKRHAVAQIENQQNRKPDADQRAAAAEDAHAAQQHHGDNVQFKAKGQVAAYGAQAVQQRACRPRLRSGPMP